MSMFPAKQHWRWTSQPLLSPNQGSHTCPWRCTETTLSLSLAPAFATPGGVHTLSFPFCRTVQVAGSLVPQPESEPKPQEWKPQALTTGPLVNSHEIPVFWSGSLRLREVAYLAWQIRTLVFWYPFPILPSRLCLMKYFALWVMIFPLGSPETSVLFSFLSSFFKSSSISEDPGYTSHHSDLSRFLPLLDPYFTFN